MSIKCTACNGWGRNPTDDELDCTHCDGEGKLCECGRPFYGFCVVCEPESKKARPCGNPKCSTSTGEILDCLTFGSGELSYSGYWEKPCGICARAHEAKYPDDGECWPFKPDSKMRKMFEKE